MKKFPFVVLVMLPFLFGCPINNNTDPDPAPSTNIEGYWDNGEIIVQIEGTEGKFYEIRQGEWKRAWEQGFVDIGSLKFRYIAKLKDDEFYQGQELWHRTVNLVVQETAWSGTGEFNLRNDGNTLYVNTINPWGTNWSTVEYTRVYP